MKRLHYLDMIKGLAIFMVVMGHALTICVREIDRTPLFKFIEQVHMPLFFFVSGWLAVYLTPAGTLKAPALGPRAKRLLLPMLGASTLWLYYFPHSGLQSPLDYTWAGMWTGMWKNGYWFTLVLFEIFAIYAALAQILKRLTGLWNKIIVSGAAWALIVLLWRSMPPVVAGLLSLELCATFFPVFMAGVFARLHSEAFYKACSNGIVTAAAMVATVLCLIFVCWPWEYDFGTTLNVLLARVVLHMALAIIAVAVVKPWSEAAFAPERPCPGRFAAIWAYLGEKSLAIYLLHYFFLFPMPFVKPALLAFNLSFTPVLVFAAFVAAIVVGLALCADRILSISWIMRTFITGSTVKTAKS